MTGGPSKEIVLSVKISSLFLVIIITLSLLYNVSQIIFRSPNILNPEVENWSTEKKIVRHEVVSNNCDGKSPSMTVSRSVTLGKIEAINSLSTTVFGMNISLANEVGGNIMHQIESEYQNENALSVTETTEVQLVTPPNYIVTHYIFWEETYISATVKFHFIETTHLDYPISVSLNNRKSSAVACDSIIPDQQGIVEPPLTSTTDLPSVTDEEDTPIRQHHDISAGSGVFENATYSDGLAPYSYDWLVSNGKFNIQRVRKEENPNGCAVALYSSNKVWFTGDYNQELLINGQIVGVYKKPANAHGYVLTVTIEQGDIVCVSSNNLLFFSLIFGPDIYYQYDSYCYRGLCD